MNKFVCHACNPSWWEGKGYCCQYEFFSTKIWWQPCMQSHGKIALSDYLNACRQLLSHNHASASLNLYLYRSMSWCVKSVDKEKKSRWIISTSHSASPPPSYKCTAQWKQPLPWAFHTKVSGHPYYFLPLPRKTCSVWLFGGFIWWHRSHKERDGERGLSLTARWMPQVTAFCFSKIHSHAGFAEAKGGGQGEQLVHLFRLVEQTMAVSELVTFPGLLHCSSGAWAVALLI